MRPANWDLVMAALTAAHAALLLVAPSVPAIAVAMWWSSNTIAHNFIHRPFFGTKWANALFALWLSLLLGYPQSLWRDRHLAHHAGHHPVLRITAGLVFQSIALVALWMALAVRDPRFLLLQYLPGWLFGLGLCAIHGYYEHARGVTSHYGRLYNVLCFNDGYHVEHHAWPGFHWTRLTDKTLDGETSRWPAPLRWMESFSVPTVLEQLERMVLCFPLLERWVLRMHHSAFRRIIHEIPSPTTIAIVGGGLFPRTVLILRELLPHASVTVIDSNREHLKIAAQRVAGPSFVHEHYSGQADDFDLVILPLSLRGDREALYRSPPSRTLVAHDWLWRPRGHTSIVSYLLLKRLNVVMRCD
jgi:hypothetical protein